MKHLCGEPLPGMGFDGELERRVSLRGGLGFYFFDCSRFHLRSRLSKVVDRPLHNHSKGALRDESGPSSIRWAVGSSHKTYLVLSDETNFPQVIEQPPHPLPLSEKPYPSNKNLQRRPDRRSKRENLNLSLNQQKRPHRKPPQLSLSIKKRVIRQSACTHLFPIPNPIPEINILPQLSQHLVLTFRKSHHHAPVDQRLLAFFDRLVQGRAAHDPEAGVDGWFEV